MDNRELQSIKASLRRIEGALVVIIFIIVPILLASIMMMK
jgi:hypothetical protein